MVMWWLLLLELFDESCVFTVNVSTVSETFSKWIFSNPLSWIWIFCDLKNPVIFSKFTEYYWTRFKNPVEPVTSGFLIEGHKYQYFESTSALLDLYWIFESTSEHLRKSRDNMWWYCIMYLGIKHAKLIIIAQNPLQFVV